jgi:xylulokinase
VITLGIDVGTTHTKVLALDVEHGRTVALEAAPTPVHRDHHGEAHRPTEVLELVIKLATSVVATLADVSAVRSLCVASVGEEVVLLDRDSTPVGDTMAWYDPRGFEQAEAFLAGPGGALGLSRRWPPDVTFSLFKLLWTREHDPEAFHAAVTWADLGDFVLHGLGGELVMDWSHASRAGAFDIVGRRWDADTIEAAGLALDFPRLVSSGTVIGRLDPDLAARVGLSAEVAVVAGGHDHLCAAYGAGVRSTRELFLSAGTSEAHLALLESPLEGEAGRGVDQGCFVDDHTWYVHTNIHSGHFFKQWRELLYDGVDDVAMYAEVAAAGTDGITFDVADDMRRGRFEAVPYDAGRAVLMRAVLEGLARRSASIVRRLEIAAGRPYELILAAGHPARLPLWRALREAAYARPMAAVDEPEIAAFGAAVLAARAVVGDAAAPLVAARTAWDF